MLVEVAEEMVVAEAEIAQPKRSSNASSATWSSRRPPANPLTAGCRYVPRFVIVVLGIGNGPTRARLGPITRGRRKEMHKCVLLAGGLTFAAAGLVALACTANASDSSSGGSGSGGMIKQPTMSYTSPANTSQPVQRLSPGQPVDVVCVTNGQTINNNSYWARINSDGVGAFVHRDAVHIPAYTQFCR